MMRDYADRNWVKKVGWRQRVEWVEVIKLTAILTLFIGANSFAYQDDLEQQARRNQEQNIRMQREIQIMQNQRDQQLAQERSQRETDIREGRSYPWQ